VLTHAIIDALLGALAKGDIGQHFPDTDLRYKNMESLAMLAEVMGWLVEEGFRVMNADTTVVAERPKLAPHLTAMREKLSRILDVQGNQINIKATTSEGMGFCGREEGIAAYAVVSLVRAEGKT